MFIKLSKNLSAKYYQQNKEILQKKAHKRYQNISKDETKTNNMVANITQISHKMKNKGLLSIGKFCKMRKNAVL